MRHSTKPASDDDSISVTAAAASGGGNPGSPSHQEFNVGEVVLANHKGHYYEAKVEKVELREEWMYFIHYRGWNKSWDEWVGVQRLLPITEEIMKDLMESKKFGEKSGNHGRILQSKLENGNGGRLCILALCSDDTGKKQKNLPADSDQKRKRKHSVDKGKDIVPVEKLVNISIPLSLKKQLIGDNDFIVQKDKLFKLPRSPNVVDILKRYHDYRKQKDGVISGAVDEILRGLRDYFDKALPVMLLYNKERQQYHDIAAENISPSLAYGAEHLLRLFVKLPALLFDLNIDEETSQQLQQNLNDFLKFLQKNQGTFFISTCFTAEDSETSSQRDCG